MLRKATRVGHSSAGNRLLDGLPESDLARLRPCLQLVPLEPKHFFLPANEQLEYVYFPCDGLVSLAVVESEGRGVQAASVGQDGMLGVSVVFDANYPPFDMACLIRGQALRMSTGAFQDFLRELPAFAARMQRYAHGLFNETVRTAGCNRLHPVEQRLARCLLLARDRLERDGFPLTHDALAHMLGVTRPFVSRTLTSLTSEGVIRHERGMLQLVDTARLRQRACEDYVAIQAEYTRLLG